jgi:hypothetical protein
VGHSRMAEYEFEIKGIKYKASVDTYPSEPVTYTNYYQKEFEELFKGKILGGIDDLDLFSGCEYDVNFFSFYDSTPGEHNPRYSGGLMFPTFVTPDNFDEYLTASDVSPLNITIVLYYYGPASKKVSVEKVHSIWEDFYPTQYVNMEIKHFETRKTADPKSFLGDYHFHLPSTVWTDIEYSYYDLADGVILRSPYGNYGFEYSLDNNTLNIKAVVDYQYLLFISRDRISNGDKYYKFYTDSEGKKKKNTETWSGDSMYINGEYSIPLR